jgi:Ni,Fe-hydrogenase III small subunit
LNRNWIPTLQELKILKSHGRQYIPDLSGVSLHDRFRGRPEISETVSADDADELAEICPVGAITSSPEITLDLGKCLFCGECCFRKPALVRFTNDYKMATNCRNDLIIKPGKTDPVAFRHDKVRREIRSIFGRALKLRQISAGGDNAAEMELNAAGNVNFDLGRFGVEFLASPRHCDGIVITGPLTANMSEAVELCYEAVPSPKIIVLAGADAISGGLFADSAAINRNFLNDKDIDLYVPGNPVHPLTFINGLMSLLKITD